jgi:hypothetical protein
VIAAFPEAFGPFGLDELERMVREASTMRLPESTVTGSER